MSNELESTLPNPNRISSRPQILIADQDWRVANYLHAQLPSFGLDNLVVWDPDKLLSYATKPALVRPNLILYDPQDFDLPIGELHHIAPDLPLIVMSADANSCNITAALNEGADDFLPKPLTAVEAAIYSWGVLRRTLGEVGINRPPVLHIGEGVWDPTTHGLITRQGRVEHLGNEAEILLRTMIENACTAQPLKDLLRAAQRHGYGAKPDPSFYVHLMRIKEAFGPEAIVTTSGKDKRSKLYQLALDAA